MKRIILIIGIIALFVPLSAASAHRPLWGEQYGPIEIPNLSTSFAVYRDLAAGQIDVYTFEGAAGQELHAGIQVPAVRGLEDYGVSAALFGPDFPAVEHDALPPDHPEGLGALIFSSVPTEDYFEPFTLTNYWGRQQIDLALPADGAYYLLVWHPDGRAGKYVLDTGRAEVFGPADLFRFPVWFLRVHLFFGHGLFLALVGGSLLLAVILLVARRRGRVGNNLKGVSHAE